MGIGFDEFYDYTFAEFLITVEAYNKKKKDELREKAQMDYILADLIGASVARLLDKRSKYPKFEKVYNFTEKSSDFDKKSAEKPEKNWDREVAFLYHYAAVHNAKRNKQNKEVIADG